MSSKVDEFFPMRSIIKVPLDQTPSEANRQSLLSEATAKTKPMKRRKTVRFDDMVLIGDDQQQI